MSRALIGLLSFVSEDTRFNLAKKCHMAYHLVYVHTAIVWQIAIHT